jgi:branched-chain amino acid transport system permease protein
MASRYANSLSWRQALIGLLALAVLSVPQVSSNGFLLSFLSQAAIVAVFALSYNMLLGQTGLLSFGHAIYAGLGGYATIHVMNRLGADGLGGGMLLMPILGGLGGAAAGVVFGYISTRCSGTTYAMITLGLAEMLAALALMLPGFSGGDAGITTDRMLDHAFFGINLGSDTQIYYFVWAWMLIATGLMFAFTKTPLGRLANATRDNAERVAFIGFNPQKIRWMVMVIAGFFAGIAGALNAINYELVTIENLGIGQSGMVLVAAYLGGTGFFLGPVVGAFIYVLFLSVISTMTQAWLLYFGVLFIAVVMFAPAGIVSLLGADYWRDRAVTVQGAVGAVLACALFVVVVEAIYAYQAAAGSGNPVSLAGIVDAGPEIWLPAVGLAIVYGVLAAMRRKSGERISRHEHPIAGDRHAKS